jgi:hypothetical protein
MPGMPNPTPADQAGIDQIGDALDDLVSFSIHAVELRDELGNGEQYADQIRTLEQVLERMPERLVRQLLAMLLGRFASVSVQLIDAARAEIARLERNGG